MSIIIRNKIHYLFVFLMLIYCSSCKEDSQEDKLKQLAILDTKLEIPKVGEWLSDHPENGQTFEEYKKKNPTRITKDRNCIYIQPIGNFTEQEKKIVSYTVQYVGLYFGLKTKQLESIGEESIPKENKRIIDGNNQQLDASYINNKILPFIIPKDGIVIMAITAKDLYPDPTWNYVFGLASYKKRTGISSFYRFKDANFSDKNYCLCLKRIIKTATHEIGHMFTMHHCTHALCVMNGANSLSEDDTKPLTLCSECLQKISWNLKFDNQTRFNNLIQFLKQHQLELEVSALEKQLDVIN